MKAALIFIFTLVMILCTLSCNNQKTDFNLNPKLEIMSDSVIKWNEKEYNINLVDSILLNYKKEIDSAYYDAIRLNLVIDKPVRMGTVTDIKNALLRNKIFNLTYKAK